MKTIFCAALAATISLVGCGSRLVRESYSSPTIGAITTRSVGDSLIEQLVGQLTPEFELLQDTVVGKTKIPKGRYEFDEENKTEICFNDGDDLSFCINKADQTVCIDEKDCIKVEYILNKKLTELDQNSFQKTLLYNGKIGNKITLGYREFSGGMARPAFSNSVDYDLSESTIVGYKGARLEIVKATNTELTYRVLSNFSQ